MRFVNDMQRKAVMSRLNKFSEDPKTLRVETPQGTMLVKEDFIKAMESDTVKRLPKKKSPIDIIKEEGGSVQRMDEMMSLKPLEAIKEEYNEIWLVGSYEESLKNAVKFLRRHTKSTRPGVRDWANKELDGIFEDIRTEKEEAAMEDPSRGRDPDYMVGELELRRELDYQDDRRDAGYLD